jgi:hypothetical protein
MPLYSKLLITTKNIGLIYLIGGLFISPEIYNPLIAGMKLK